MLYRVGQRVRVVGMAPGAVDESRGRMIGAEGVIARRSHDPRWEWIVDLPTVRGFVTTRLAATEWHADSCMLVPLTDPKADAFIENIKRLKPYEDYDAYRPARKVTA